jgi:uncharacterized damage-inducible protein DinB
MPEISFVNHLITLFNRDLTKLQQEMEAYPDDGSRWKIAPGIANSGGNLCLHLMGNLQHYVGFRLGGFAYTRNRPEEFSQKNIPLPAIIELLNRTKQVVTDTLSQLTAEKLAETYPEKVFEYEMQVDYFLLHLLAHLDYHLGQINYHRRLLTAGA